MECKYNIKKLYWIFGACLVIFIIFVSFYITGVFKNINKNTISSIISYVEENAHTGLDKSPGAKIAFEQPTKPEKKFAITVPKKIEQVAVGEGRQLFDISLEIDNVSVYNAEDLGLRVNFTNFGEISTPITMTFNIIDSSGMVVYSKTENISVETEVVYNKSFAGLALSPGDYTMQLRTLYNTNVKDEFDQPFEIRSSFSWTYVRFFVAGFLAVIIVIALFLPQKWYLWILKDKPK